MSRVDIGFYEECEAWRLESPQFPSKLGGKPSWLSYKNLPNVENLKCATCSNPKTFLCQVYAPYEECDHNFHRTIFIFACRNVSCCKKNDSTSFSVFRSNLPRRNEFYSFDPPDENHPISFDTTKWGKLCALCGCAAEKSCSKCSTTPYCTREHQVKHWKLEHKKTCGDPSFKSSNCTNSHLFPEFELVIEPEEMEEKQEVKVVDIEKELETCAEMHKTSALPDAKEADLDEHATIDGDKTFTKFRKRVDYNPEQVLRYERDGIPLWIAAGPLPQDIPACICGSPRRFEFQVILKCWYH